VQKIQSSNPKRRLIVINTRGNIMIREVAQKFSTVKDYFLTPSSFLIACFFLCQLGSLVLVHASVLSFLRFVDFLLFFALIVCNSLQYKVTRLFSFILPTRSCVFPVSRNLFSSFVDVKDFATVI
jgi:hypothetical protein